MNATTSTQDHDHLERARGIEEGEAERRSEKRWRIFSWSSSLLIGGIAGAGVLKEDDVTCTNRLLLAGAVMVLAAYTVSWLWFNWLALSTARDNIQLIHEKLGTYKEFRPNPLNRPKCLSILSYEATVVLLAGVAILIIELPCLQKLLQGWR